MKTVTDLTEKDTELALSLYVPFLRLHLLSQTLAEETEKGRGNPKKKLFNKEWGQLGVADNSSKLKQAAEMLTLGYIDNSEDTLLPVSKTLYRHPLCNCSNNRVFPELNHLVNWTQGRPNITISELFRDIFQPCVVFLPSEHIITPKPINYEMIRTFGMPVMSGKDKVMFSWYHWAIVEGLFLGQFLITKTCLYNFDPLKPHFYIVKLGFTVVYIIFVISAQKHRLWVLVRTASTRWF